MTTLSDAKPVGWARIWPTARPFARPMPRAGAWYPVVGEASGERAVLEIGGKRVAVAKHLLEVRPDRPRSFTVVVWSRDSEERVLGAGATKFQRMYAVCPECADRTLVFENQPKTTCRKCGHHADVAWWETG